MIVIVIVVGFVVIFFFVCFIVFMVEANVVVKCKIVMCGDEINCGIWQMIIMFKNIVGGSKMFGKCFQR